MASESPTFAEGLRMEGRSENTIRAYVSDVRQFINWCRSHGQSYRSVQTQASAYLNDLRTTAKPATVNRRASAIRAYARIILNQSVLETYKGPTPVPGEAHPLPNGPDDLRAVLEHAWPRHEPFIALCGFAGARVSEALAARRRDFNQDDTGIWWVTLRGKGSKDRRVPLPDEALDWLALGKFEPDDLIGHGLSDRAAREAITKAGKRAGLSRPISSHDLRMTFGTAAYHAGDLRTTQELLGHSSPVTTARYSGVTEDHKRNAVNGAFS